MLALRCRICSSPISATTESSAVRNSEMIGADIRGEREAIACYDRILAVIREDPIRTVIGEIRADEERHLALLEEMRSSL